MILSWKQDGSGQHVVGLGVVMVLLTTVGAADGALDGSADGALDGSADGAALGA